MELLHYELLKSRIKKSEFSSEFYFIRENLINPCNSPEKFSEEYIWVIINSGMKYQIASKIYYKVIQGLDAGIPAKYIFNHEEKAKAIEYGYSNKLRLYDEYQKSAEKINFLQSLPWIGRVTKYHLARNLGLNVCKPDRHLVRISKKFNKSPDNLCKELSERTGDLVGIVDFVLWGSGNMKLI